MVRYALSIVLLPRALRVVLQEGKGWEEQEGRAPISVYARQIRCEVSACNGTVGLLNKKGQVPNVSVDEQTIILYILKDSGIERFAH